MTDEQRASVASYFAVYQGQEKGLAKMFLRDVNHPFVSQAYQTLSSVWLEVLLRPTTTRAALHSFDSRSA